MRITAVDAGKLEFSPAEGIPIGTVFRHVEASKSTAGVSKRA